MFLPVRRLIPVLAGYDIELTVAVHVGQSAGFAGADIDLVFAETDIAGPPYRPEYRSQREEDAEK
jgi:hypothetical protein